MTFYDKLKLKMTRERQKVKVMEHLLQCKRKLRFPADGIFKILMVSDIQESASYDERTLRTIEGLLDKEKPNLVIWGGDNCYGPNIQSEQDFRTFLDVFSTPMECRHIPWAHVFGNHDHDLFLDDHWQQSLYEQYPYCVSKHTEGIGGLTNFMLPLYKHGNEEIAFAVWFLDTNNLAENMNHLVPSGNMAKESLLPRMPADNMIWDVLRFEQLMWYWNSSVALEKYCKQKIPAMMCMHIAPYEYLRVAANPKVCGLTGSSVEQLTPGVFNSGIFSEILQRGDVRCICCGHTHRNDFSSIYCGIQLCYDGCVGFSCYGDDNTRGGRIFEISEHDPWNIRTRMVHATEVLR